MPPIVKRVLRNRWFTAGIHAGFWLLLYLAVVNLGGKVPDLRDAEGLSTPPRSPVPVAGLERLFSQGVWPKSLTDTNLLNPFVTRYFIPQAPPPPTTRKIEVTYQGFYQTGEEPNHTAAQNVDDPHERLSVEREGAVSTAHDHRDVFEDDVFPGLTVIPCEIDDDVSNLLGPCYVVEPDGP